MLVSLELAGINAHTLSFVRDDPAVVVHTSVPCAQEAKAGRPP